MSKTVSSISAKGDVSDRGFSLRDFKRLVLLASRRRTILGLGLLATVVFACLHTVSIGTAFPLFKILLEDEGIRGWTDRTVAGWRLGVQLAPPSELDVLIVKVSSDGAGSQAGLQTGDRLMDPAGRPVTQLLADLAHGAAGTAVPVRVHGVGLGEPDTTVVRPLTPAEPDAVSRAVQWASTLIPGDGAEDCLATLKYLLVGLVAVVVLANVFRYVGEVLIVKAVLQAMMTLRGDLYERTLHLPMTYFSGANTADMVSRFVQDVQEIQRGMLTLFSKFIREPMRAAFVLVFAFALDWRMTLSLLIVAPITGLIFWRVGRRVKRSSKKLLRAYGEMIGALTASLQNLRVVKAYTAERHERDRLHQVDLRVFRQQFKLARLQAFVSPAMETVVVFAACLLTVWLAGRVLEHQMSMAKFATLGVALTMLFDPLRKLTDVYVRVQRSTAGAERIFQVLDHPIESDADSSHIELEPLKDKIEFAAVTFTYPGADRPALDHI
ncbi:MAG: hypothetical protein IID33_15265, partial [Planctomycetes bacterium]|nr:hypothetical protein [Planctomycetota bacterium]